MSHKFYKPARARLHRSELAVPGSSPKMFEKALNSKADVVFLDLEDAVSPNDKLSSEGKNRIPPGPGAFEVNFSLRPSSG